MNNRRNYLDRPVSALAYDRAMRSWMAMLTGKKPWDQRRKKRCLRVIEGTPVPARALPSNPGEPK